MKKFFSLFSIEESVIIIMKFIIAILAVLVAQQASSFVILDVEGIQQCVDVNL